MAINPANNDNNTPYCHLKPGDKIEDLKKDTSNWEKYGPLFELVDTTGKKEGIIEEDEISLLQTIKQTIKDFTPENIKDFINNYKSSGKELFHFTIDKIVSDSLRTHKKPVEEKTDTTNAADYIWEQLRLRAEAEQKIYELSQNDKDTLSAEDYIIEQLKKSAAAEVELQKKIKQIEEELNKNNPPDTP